MKRLFALATLVFLFNPNFVSAEIANPYVLDEKSQVLFGDSTNVISEDSAYQGLENYMYEYVNDYLHMTFTYTHSRFAVSDYPPRLYITATNPQATTSPGEKDRSIIYQLHAIPIPPGHETDWYIYDIQFDSAGYSVSVFQGGVLNVAGFHIDISDLSSTDYASLVNLYPNNGNAFSMAFMPLPIYETSSISVATTTPVIILPGITASILKDGNNEKWPNTFLMAASFEDLYLNDLILDSNGENVGSIIPDSLIRNLLGHDFFDGLFSTLESAGYIENESSFEFPYDWRLDINNSVLSLKEKIDAIKAERGVDRVNIVAHSMGGLLVKKYLKDYGGDSVNKFIDIGTPHLGAPKALKILQYGDNFNASILFGLIGLNTERIKIISQNMPSVYQLLPSQHYFNNEEYYVFDGEESSNDSLDFAQTTDYLKSQGRNSVLIDKADAFHQEIDGLDPEDYGVESYNIVGCGIPTLGKFYLFEEGEHSKYNIGFIDGDGTVPLTSAEAMAARKTYYLRDAKHALIPGDLGVRELVVSLLTSSSTFDVSLYPNLSMNSNECFMPAGRIVSMHSPINLHIYDQSGHHVGPDINGDIESNIPGVVYEMIGDNKFAFLPNGSDYTIKGSATGPGTFDVRIQEVVNSEVINTTLWNGVALSATTQTKFSIDSHTPIQIFLDDDNDGFYESLVDYSTSVLGILNSTGKIVQVSKEPEVFDGTSRSAVNQAGDVLGAETKNPLEIEVVIKEVEASLIYIMESFISILQREIAFYSRK